MGHDPQSTEQLMRDAVSTAELAALAQALGKIGDRRSIEELQRMAGDKQLSSLARSFAAAAKTQNAASTS